MANKLTIEVVVSDNGTAKLVQKGIEGVGKAAESTTKKTKEASKAQDELNYKLNQGATGVSSAARSFSKLSQAIGDGPNGLVGAYATLAANAFAVSAAFNTLKEASQVELVMKGLEVQGARLGVTLTNTARQVEELARGSLSAAEAMQATAQTAAAGFNAEAIQELTKAAQNASIALGRNMADSMDRIIKGTTKLEPELLDELGIMVKLNEATAQYALATGKSANSLTSFEKRQAFLNAVLEESRNKFGGLSEEVDADPYSKLAAAFKNLTTETLQFVNNSLGVKAFVNFLADNTTALTAVIIMFAGTISRQLVPSLYEVSEATLRAKDAINKKIEAQKQQIATTLKLAEAEKKAASASTASKVDVVGSPEKVKAYVKAIRDGNVVEGQREQAIKSLNGALGGHEAALNRIKDQDSEAALKKKALIEELKNQKKALESLTSAEINHANIVSASQNKLDGLRRQSVGLRLQNLAQTSRANAIEAAGEFNIARSYTEGRKSAEAYRRGIQNVATGKVAAAASSGLFSRSIAAVTLVSVPARAALFTLSLGVRALGAALLNAIPIIGQILFVISLLVEFGGKAWDWMFPPPEGQEALDKAKETLDETLKRVDETAKKTSVVFADKGANATEAAGAYLALSNTLREVADNLSAVELAQKQLGTTAAKAPEKMLTSAFEEAGKKLSSNVIDSEAFKSLSSLTKLGFEPLTEEIKQATLNSEEFNKASDSGKIDIASKAVARLSKKYGEVGQAIADLRTNYKELDDATSSFITSATPSTPYDNLVSKLTSTKIALNNLEAQLIKGAISAKDYNQQVSDIGTQGSALLSEGTQKQIQALQKLTAEIKNAEDQLDKTRFVSNSGAYRDVEAEVTRLKEEQVSAQEKLSKAIAADIVNQQKTMLALQRQQSILESQVKLEEARFNALKGYLDDSSLGYEVIVKHEEKIRGMQANKIRAEQAVLKLLNLQNDAKLKQVREEKAELDARIESIKAGKEQLGILDRLADKLKILSNFAFGTNYTSSLQDLEAQSKVLEGTITGLEAESSKLGAAIESMDLEVAAILAQNLTKAEIAAQKLAIDFENIKRLTDKVTSMTSELNTYEDRRASSLRDSLTSVIYESRALIGRYSRDRKAAQEAKIQAETKLNNDIRALEAARDRAGAETDAGKAIQSSINLKKEELRLTTEQFNIQEKIKAGTLALDLLEKAKVDIYSTGIQLQLDSLQGLERELDLRQQILSQQKDLTTLRLKILGKDSSGNLSAELERAIEAKAANDQYNLAKDQFGLRMEAIKAEYALLEAQRLQTLYNLKAQKIIVEKAAAADGIITEEESTSIKQLSSAVENIENINYGALQELAETSEKNILELARLKAIDAGTRGGGLGRYGGAIFQASSAARILSSITDPAAKEAKDKETKSAIEASVAIPNMSEAATKAQERLNTFAEELNAVNLDMPSLVSNLVALKDQLGAFLKNMADTGAVSETAVAGSGLQLSNGTLAQNINKLFTLGGGITGNARNLQNLDPEFERRVVSALTEYNEKTGRKPAITSGFRYEGDQAAISSGSNPKAAPGKSRHERGLALDINSADVARMNELGILQKYGLVGGKAMSAKGSYLVDPPHVEMARNAPTGTAASPIYVALEPKSVTALANAVTPAVTEPEPSSSVRDAELGSIPSSSIAKADEQLQQASGSAQNLQQQVGGLGDEITVTASEFKMSFDGLAAYMNTALAPIIEDFSKLGPNGEVIATALSGITALTTQMSASFGIMSMDASKFKDAAGNAMDATEVKMVKTVAAMQMVSAALGAIAQILQAQSNARIASIDKEIAAEEKRDGKSAGSVDKINALAKKKDDIARKSFNVQKKLQLAQAVINTASAITMALATLPPPFGAIMAGVVGALGMAQIALISSTQYESSYAPKSVSMPSSLSIGKRGDSVNLAGGPNANAGGEVGYLRGAAGTGTNASNYRTVGSAYGGEMMRGYGNRGFVVGEKGPEVINPETPISVTPANDVNSAQPINANISIQALDGADVKRVLVDNRGNIIQMLREAANNSGQRFLEDVNVNVYTRPNIGKL